MQEEPHHPPKPSLTPRVDLLERFLRVMNEKQLFMLVEDLEHACESSGLRMTTATVEVVFKGGHPEFVNLIQGRRLLP